MWALQPILTGYQGRKTGGLLFHLLQEFRFEHPYGHDQMTMLEHNTILSLSIHCYPQECSQRSDDWYW